MSVNPSRLGAAGIAIAMLFLPQSAGAATIQFTANDLTDVFPGEDLWQYEYRVSGRVFDQDEGFTVYFDASLFEQLEDPPPPVNADWSVIVVQPDPTLLPGGAGFYDALALSANASLADPFVVSFNWLGGPGTAPGVQPFTINAFDAQGNIVIVDSGFTEPQVVPEPSTLALMIVTALGAVPRLRRRRSS